MQPQTWNKAWVAGVAAPLLNWLVGVLAAWLLTAGFAMPDAAQAALVAILTGLIVFYVPNSDPQPTVAELQARIAELERERAKPTPVMPPLVPS